METYPIVNLSFDVASEFASRPISTSCPKKYSRRLYTRKCDEVYEHVYESYYGEGRSVYGGMAA